MPAIPATNDDGKIVKRYGWPADQVTGSVAADALREWRKAAIVDRDQFLAFQKAAGASGDRDGARFFKECANRELRRQRACTLMLPWIGTPDPNQRVDRPVLWPLELVEELDEISGRLILRAG